MNNAVSGKIMKSWRNIIEVNWKRRHNPESNPNYMSEKMFGNDLVKICRRPAYFEICIWIWYLTVWYMKLKWKVYIKILVKAIILSKFYDNSNKLVVSKMKYETVGVIIKNFVKLKPKMHSFLIDDRSDHKNTKDVNKNVVIAISHVEYKDVLIQQKMFETFDE